MTTSAPKYTQLEWDLLNRVHQAELLNAKLSGKLRVKKLLIRLLMREFDVGGDIGSNKNNDDDDSSTSSGMTNDEPAISSAESGYQSVASSNHHHKTDAGLADAVIDANEADNPNQYLGSNNRSDLAAISQDQLTRLPHQIAVATSLSASSSTSHDIGSQPQTGHRTERDPMAAGAVELEATKAGYHTGKDAALVGGVAGAGALAGREYSQEDVAGYGNEPHQDTSQGHPIGREGVVAGGHKVVPITTRSRGRPIGSVGKKKRTQNRV